MKNIHVLPTDKPSRLSILNSGKLNFGAEIMSSSNSKPQHIYITSDEEIKEGDYYITPNNTVLKALGPMLINVEDYKKIILTTDQDLIKDGVQAIDDEFLEWFVNNQSCELVPIANEWKEKYKIIIPKEEPKPIHQQIIDSVGGEKRFSEIVGLEPKQETLEEAADTYAKKQYGNSCGAREERKISKEDFIEGAKWQAERMYSEEEVKHIVSEALQSALVTVDLEQWLKQFKKK